MIMHPSYSPLFTSGLLADPSSIPSPSTDIPSPVTTSYDDPTSPIYFTFHTGKRDTIELRSFLYLDLADSKRHAPSHRRKYSTLSKSTSWTCVTDLKSVHDLTRNEKPVVVSPVPPVPTRRRTSKESLRNIPSPKPVPSATLPDLPTPSDSHSASSLPSPSPSSPSRKRSTSSVVSSLLSPTRRKPASLGSASISSHDRRQSRMDALACLEGRSRAPHRISRLTTRKNFMSFSDDEDEKSPLHKPSASEPPKLASSMVQSDDPTAFADVEDEVDAITQSLGLKRDAVDMARPARPAKPARKRRGTIESWFPLKSFIDLKDDDLSSWNWRSFIEIGGIA